MTNRQLKVSSTPAELLVDIAKMIVDGRQRSVLYTNHPLIRILLYVGKIKPVIDSVYKFDDTLSAFDKLSTGHARGKVVVEIA